MSEGKAARESEEEAKRQAVKEEAVHQHRHWVRVTFACNNRCMFCLDGDAPKAGHRSAPEVRAEIVKGYKPGARLILSGGEASIHPDFIDFVHFGRETGYAWIQTITNGRMFAYAPFAKSAADAGLSEVTFSMHGHTSALHDELTGIPGGFAQALRGMMNLLKDGRVVVNVDCVINGMNVRDLPDILAFYQKLGIHEFDLLQIVPFGRAWQPGNRERLFYDLESNAGHLQKAFSEAARPGNYIWTNRFPPAHLEGNESLIQDPHKLFDELRGRFDEFSRYLESGEPMRCRGERCRHCFLERMCGELFALRERLLTREALRLVVDLCDDNRPAQPETAKTLLDGKIPESWRLHARDAKQAAAWLGESGLLGRGELWLDDWTDWLKGAWPKSAVFRAVIRLVTADAASLESLAEQSYELEILVTRDTEGALTRLKERLGQRAGLILRLPSAETLAETSARIPDPREFFAGWIEYPIAAYGIPACIHPGARKDLPEIRLSSLQAGGGIDLYGFTRDFIRYDYTATSVRCRDCEWREGCPGLHINTLRLYGFRQLRPMGSDRIAQL